MENLGAMAYSRYTGFREITDRDVLELHCSHSKLWGCLDTNDKGEIIENFIAENDLCLFIFILLQEIILL